MSKISGTVLFSLLAISFLTPNILQHGSGDLKSDSSRIKKAACHEEYDFINSKSITVCGNWTEYPSKEFGYVETNHNSTYQNWMKRGVYSNVVGRISYKDPISGKSYPTDVILPSNIDSTTIRYALNTLSKPADATTVKLSYTVTKSVETTITHAASISIGKEISTILNTHKFKIGASYSFTYSSTNYTSKSFTTSMTFTNDKPNVLMEILQYRAYIPVKLRMYKVFKPGSYVYKEDYFLFGIRDVVIRSWEHHGFTDPWNIRGFVPGVNIRNDIIQTDPILN